VTGGYWDNTLGFVPRKYKFKTVGNGAPTVPLFLTTGPLVAHGHLIVSRKRNGITQPGGRVIPRSPRYSRDDK